VIRRVLVVVFALAALAAVPTPQVARAVPDEHPDFATQTYGDPWDFSNPEDLDPQQRWWSTKSSNFSVHDGMLSFDTSSFGEIPLVRGFGAIAIPWGRDGSAHPIDASKYTRIAFRLNSPVTTQGQITWYTCGTLDQSCLGGMPIQIKPGWNTYDVGLKKGYAQFPMGWAGPITSLTLVPVGANITSAHIDIDWVRVYDPTTTGPPTPVSQLMAEPLPGSDYAAINRGDAWDMSQTTDVLPTTRNASISFDGQLLIGQNAGPAVGDPIVDLPVTAPFSGTRFHRFSARVFYDGGFSLAGSPGGGMDARVLWTVQGNSTPQTSHDILIYPGWQTITFDMNVPNINDETQTTDRMGWKDRIITSFRFDPNEDPGQRNWKIDWVRLGSDKPFGSFDIASRTDGGVAVGGWSIDPNTTAPTQMRVFVDNTVYAIPAATGIRNDVAAIFPAFGNAHGFNGLVPASAAPHRICVWAINIGPGGHGLIGCRYV
jgi:hypothetical protein